MRGCETAEQGAECTNLHEVGQAVGFAEHALAAGHRPHHGSVLVTGEQRKKCEEDDTARAGEDGNKGSSCRRSPSGVALADANEHVEAERGEL